MTLIAVWYRSDHDDLYAIADSRVRIKEGVLSDRMPKFSVVTVRCCRVGKTAQSNRELLLEARFGIGYAGNANVALATTGILQSYCTQLCLNEDGNLPVLGDIAELAREILLDYYKEFGQILDLHASCYYILFGSLGPDELSAYLLQTSIDGASTSVALSQLPVREEHLCISFGSASNFFNSEIQRDMRNTGKFHAFNLLERILTDGTRSDIGGAVQVAIATRGDALLPNVLKFRQDKGPYQADLTFLGRELPTVGDCTVGLWAVGPRRDEA